MGALSTLMKKKKPHTSKWESIGNVSHLADEINRISSSFEIPADLPHIGVISDRPQADGVLVRAHGE